MNGQDAQDLFGLSLIVLAVAAVIIQLWSMRGARCPGCGHSDTHVEGMGCPHAGCCCQSNWKGEQENPHA